MDENTQSDAQWPEDTSEQAPVMLGMCSCTRQYSTTVV